MSKRESKSPSSLNATSLQSILNLKFKTQTISSFLKHALVSSLLSQSVQLFFITISKLFLVFVDTFFFF